MSLLAILDEGPAYGLQLRNDFEARTGGVFPLNAGQVYTTLGRLERDGLVREVPDDGEREVVYEITKAGRGRLEEWFSSPTAERAPARDELVLKIVMAAARDGGAPAVIQAERKAAVQTLQAYTRLKREAPRDADLGWQFLLDSLIFQSEARVRWLDACEARLGRARPRKAPARVPARTEVRR
jgi:DNA-binding PadR family transcriptional regulator